MTVSSPTFVCSTGSESQGLYIYAAMFDDTQHMYHGLRFSTIVLYLSHMGHYSEKGIEDSR